MENFALVTIKVPSYNTSSTRPSSSSSNSSNNSSNSSGSTAKLLSLPPIALPAMPAIGNSNLTRSECKPMQDDCPLGVKFVSAGMAACIADLVTFPLDTAKVRLQIQGEVGAGGVAAPKRGLFSTIANISRTEGARALYSGLAPGLQRQMCFASVRIGLYDTVKQGYSNLLDVSPNQQNIGLRILAGITTGGAAVLVAQPTDVVKVRMQAQGRVAGGQARYTGSMMAYRTIALNEGVRGLWKGTVPNVSRNAIVNCTELVSYDLIKEAILSNNVLKDGIPCHFIAAVGAGFFTTLFASPVDVLKTRFMNSPAGQYAGVIDCARSMVQEGGLKTFYKGAVPAFLRFGPWNVVMFISYEQLKKRLCITTDGQKQKGGDNVNNNNLLTLAAVTSVSSVSSRTI